MFSATAIANFLACQHISVLDRAESRKEIAKPFFSDPTVDLLRTLGLEHEQRYLRALTEDNHRVVAKIDVNASWQDSTAETIQALRQGVDVVYQATFLDGYWGGRSDFLLRVDRASALGDWSYEPVETKLAHSTKPGALIQLCFYSELLSRIQGIEPQSMYVVLGSTATAERYSVQRYIAYFRKIKREFETAWGQEAKSYPEPVEHCEICSWFPVCDARWRSDDYLALVAGISRSQRNRLCDHNIKTVVSLAGLVLPANPKIDGIGEAALLRIHDQARLQVKGREAGHVVYELLEPVGDDRGLSVLPLPSFGDFFLDIEANPYVLDGGLEYLIGFLTGPRTPDEEANYEALWSFSSGEEKNAFETFMGNVMSRWELYPDMHIYHYAPYEPTAIKRLAGRHGIYVEEVDQLLRAGIFVDLYHVVRQALRASVESYSIKRLEPLYSFTRAVPLREANAALSSFEAILALGRNREEIETLLKTVEGYNRDDCGSAFRLRYWLEERRCEAEKRTLRALARPVLKTGKPGIELAAQLDQVAETKELLLGTLPDDNAQWTTQNRAQWILAQLLEWHRREEKSSWWEFFRLCGLSDEELQEDSSALGGLVCIGEVERTKRSIVYRYSFPPQDHAIDRALEVRDPRTQKHVGQVMRIDERNRTIDIKRSATSSLAHPTALIPFDIVDSEVLRDSLLRLGTGVASYGMSSAGSFQAARKLLTREPPRSLGGGLESLIDEAGRLTHSAVSLISGLADEATVLPIQGPPGTGKTFTGARMIVELAKKGRRVGVTAVSHKVISNLLREVCRAAAEVGVSLRAIQKANDEDQCEDKRVGQAKDNRTVRDALTTGAADVAGGTVWLWARPEMRNSVDVLFVDEAGQMSLANVLAISQAAKSIVLLGDPQQLDQPQHGVHPLGAEVSALGHLLNGNATISPEQGIFLSETRRLHPDVCEFISVLFYDGRLSARPENRNQRLNTAGPLDGTGLRFSPVQHSGNSNESEEEVEKVASLVSGLLQAGTTWTNKKGETLPLRLEDILIVAPYNAQVAALAQRLPQGARIGTVDKFQGQEAPVVFYSMATSMPEDAPRGMEFLYSLNRLNVAISRARCVATIVANPALFRVQCRTPHQIELANAFCRFLEIAEVQTPPGITGLEG